MDRSLHRSLQYDKERTNVQYLPERLQQHQLRHCPHLSVFLVYRLGCDDRHESQRCSQLRRLHSFVNVLHVSEKDVSKVFGMRAWKRKKGKDSLHK